MRTYIAFAGWNGALVVTVVAMASIMARYGTHGRVAYVCASVQPDTLFPDLLSDILRRSDLPPPADPSCRGIPGPDEARADHGNARSHYPGRHTGGLGAAPHPAESQI